MWQRKLFDDGPGSLSDEQRERIADLLAELLVSQLDRLLAIVSQNQREQENHDA